MPGSEDKETNQQSAGRVLVVDDQAYYRRKIELSVLRLGHQVTTADSAHAAITLLKQQPLDLLLLDIVMPDQDGYAVLEWLQAQDDLAHIPVIVISAHEDRAELVVKAIEMGAVDFLSKQFALPVLSARIRAGLHKKRNRDKEIEQGVQIEKLMRASKLLEKSIYNPRQLRLASITDSNTPLATFAGVFSNMAQRIYDREKRLEFQVKTLQSFGLLLMTGVLFGLDAPMAKWLSGYSTNALGMAIWVSAVVVMLVLPWAIYTRNLPKPSWFIVWYFLLWGFCTCVLGDVLLLMVAENIQASVVVIIMVTEVLMVYAYSAMTKLEDSNRKRLLGVGIGFTGVVLVVWAQSTAQGSTSVIWAILALGVPLGYAVIDIMIALNKRTKLHPATSLAMGSIGGLVIMVPIAWYQDGFLSLSLKPGLFEAGVLLWGGLTLLAMLVYVKLVTSAGAVFASQTAYVQTVSGIGVSFVVLGESLSLIVWIALAVIVIGMLLVEPKREPEKELSKKDLKLLLDTV